MAPENFRRECVIELLDNTTICLYDFMHFGEIFV